MIDVFILDEVNEVDDNATKAASRLGSKCISIDPRSHPLSSVDSFSSDSFEINNNTKDCHLSIQSSSFSSEDFDGNSSCDNVVKRDKQSKQQLKNQQAPLKGILKYPFDWQINKNTINDNADSDNNRKTKSIFNSSGPSSLDSDDQGYYGASCESPDSEKYLQNYVSFAVEQSTIKKGVTWAEKDVIFVFRKGSSILGCRKKNQKKAKRKREKARLSNEDDYSGTDNSPIDSDIESVRLMIANQRFSVSGVEDFDSVSDASSSGCDCSTSEASGDEEALPSRQLDEPLNYKDEKTFEGSSNKQKRKKQRKRNRKSKQTVRNRLETGYDSD